MSKIQIPERLIEQRIFIIRGKKVMIDRDLAELYNVPTKRLKEQVRRNILRFPSDFMFQLSKEEMADWRSQFATSNSDKMGLRWRAYVFTEQGIAMLSSVLHSKRAIQVNIQIMRTFTKLQEMMVSQKALAEKIEAMEKKYDRQFVVVFDAIRKLLEEPKPKSKGIGFHV